MFFLAVLVVLGGLGNSSWAATKLWRHNTNYSNVDNWWPKRLPCAADRVLFPRNFGSLIVQLPDGNTKMRELVLPPDGDFVFPFSGSLVFTGESEDTPGCKGEDMVFTRTEPRAWLDPENWLTEEPGTPQDVDVVKPVPHLERIPCRHDHVVFPQFTSIAVQLPEVPVVVGFIHLHSLNLTTEEDWPVVAAMGNMLGVRSFVGNEDQFLFVNVRGEECTDRTGCACESARGTYGALLREMVCSYGRRQCEEEGPPPCFEPVTPEGHCCAMCGAHLLVEYDDAYFSMESLRREVKRRVGPDVVAHVGKLRWDRVQVVLADRGKYQARSPTAASSLADALRQDHTLGVMAVTVYASGEVYFSRSWGLVAGPIFGTLFAVLAALGVIFLVFVTFRHRIPLGILDGKSFVFARFENAGDGEGEVVQVLPMRVPPRYDVLEDEESLGKSFDNPMYGNTKGAAGSAPRKVTHENPVYSELQRRTAEQEDLTEMAELSCKSETMELSDEAELVEVDIEQAEPATP